MDKRKKHLLMGIGTAALVLALSAFWLFEDAWAPLSSTPYPISASKFHSWEEVFAAPAPIGLQTWQAGSVHMDRRMLFEGRPGAKAMPEPMAPIPVLVHWLRHGQRGEFLIDTGFDQSFSQGIDGNYGRLMRLLNRLMNIKNSVAEGQDIAAWLARSGANPHTVFLTHLHPDHTAGISALPGLSFVFAIGENTFLSRATVGNHLRGARLQTFDFSQGQPMPPLGQALDLLGDGSLWAVSTAGHTPDHVSYLVNAMSGPKLLIGDACHFGWAFDHGLAPVGMGEEDNAEAVASLEKLQAFKQAYPQVELIFGHELPARTAWGV